MLGAFSRIKDILALQSAIGKFQKALDNYQKGVAMGSLSILQALKSKTVWGAIAAFAFNAWQQYSPIVPGNIAEVVNGGIAIWTILSRMFPKQLPSLPEPKV